MNPKIKAKLEKLLQEFGCACYWYGEDTGDYDMKEIFRTENDSYSFKEQITEILELVS